MKDNLGPLVGDAAKIACQKLKLWSDTPQDKEDILQAAALGSVKAAAKTDNTSY